ncbi:MAG TPA: S41 family peptidase [Candidatus Dependentiae bacterium]|nr:S41 family peptidase [Candidatus Dependentiae bacterium]HRQ62635.1 S41 family peptidase [Candidatus Dependentiae bacterium]
MKKYIIALVALCTLSIYAPDQQKNKQANTSDFDETIYNWSQTFAEVLHLTRQKHYKAANVEHAMQQAIDAFLSNLDPHSGFLGPDTYKRMMESTSGEFFGIGIVIDNTRKPKDKHLTVVDTIPEGPADKAGVHPMDKIIEIDGVPLAGMTTEEATTKLKGARNTKVGIKVLRQDKPDLLSFTIIRDVVKEQNSLSFHIKDQNIYYLSLNTFSQNAVKQIEQLLQEANKEKYKGLILDLRNNSGGLLSSVVEISGMFLDKGSTVVITKDKENKPMQRYVTSHTPIANTTVPIFVLVNNYTASAAEILAGVLQIHSEKQAQLHATNQKKLLVFLVGTTTFGKGSVQEVIPISNDSAIKLTTRLYYLPNDKTIQGQGIKPDFMIERTMPLTEQAQWFNKNYGHESSFKNHIQVTNTDATKEQPKTLIPTKDKDEVESHQNRWITRAKEMLQQDNQLRATITLINLLGTAQATCPDRVCNRDKAVAFIKKHYVNQDQLTIEQVKI